MLTEYPGKNVLRVFRRQTRGHFQNAITQENFPYIPKIFLRRPLSPIAANPASDGTNTGHIS